MTGLVSLVVTLLCIWLFLAALALLEGAVRLLRRLGVIDWEV